MSAELEMMNEENGRLRREIATWKAEVERLDAEIVQREAHMIEYNTRINAEVMKLLNEKDALRAEVERLRSCVRKAIDTTYSDSLQAEWIAALEMK